MWLVPVTLTSPSRKSHLQDGCAVRGGAWDGGDTALRKGRNPGKPPRPRRRRAALLRVGPAGMQPRRGAGGYAVGVAAGGVMAPSWTRIVNRS